jgi:hypothetical protein
MVIRRREARTLRVVDSRQSRGQPRRIRMAS